MTALTHRLLISPAFPTACAIACAIGSVAFVAWRVACWWRGAQRYIGDVAGEAS